MDKIYPRCKLDMAEIYVTSEGIVVPCCWIGAQPYFNDYLEIHRENLDLLTLEKNGLNRILKSEAYHAVERSWTSPQPFKPCLIFCAKSAFEKNPKMHGTNLVETVVLNKK